MLIVHKYQRPNAQGSMQGHYFKSGKYIRSSDILPYSDALLKMLVKGHSLYSITKVESKTDLEFKIFKNSN